LDGRAADRALGTAGGRKGTQASRLAQAIGVPHLSTGDLLRAAVAARTPIGLEADSHIRSGGLVPDRLVLKILEERLAAADCRAGFLLDGFPRNVAQATALESIAPLDAVFSFDLPEELLVRRLSGRRVCPTCQAVYHVETLPPRVADRCDRDGTALVQRPDDRPEAVGTRFKVYLEQTAPLLDHYRGRGLLRPIDADGDPDTVQARLREAVAALGRKAPSERARGATR